MTVKDYEDQLADRYGCSVKDVPVTLFDLLWTVKDFGFEIAEAHNICVMATYLRCKENKDV